MLVGGTFVLGVVLTARTHELSWLVVSLPFALLLAGVLRYAPTGYRLGREGIHVERRAGDAVIPYRDIRGADRLARPVKGLTLGGSNGVFGRFGRFWNARLGFYRLYLSNTETIVWLATRDGLVAVSPDRPDEFLARLALRLPPR